MDAALRAASPTRPRWPPRLAAIPGIVEHGICSSRAMVERVVVAGAGGVRELVRK